MADSHSTHTPRRTPTDLDRLAGELLLAMLAIQEAEKRLAAALAKHAR